mmetsp:Transcript_14208/g.26650  ORF Transcript_14208/g.26650 Transcript_14208/m.26650 type:complete len:291 (+) Transcript_14208:70-942(+)
MITMMNHMRNHSMQFTCFCFALFFFKTQAFLLVPSSTTSTPIASAYQQHQRPWVRTAGNATTTLHMKTLQTKSCSQSRNQSIPSTGSRWYLPPLYMTKVEQQPEDEKNQQQQQQQQQQPEKDIPNTAPSLRRELGKITGISLTALRASLRATTGFSLTALRTTLRTLTGVSITGVVKRCVGLLPPWFRYFLQPFLILYYVPLLVLREMVGSTETSKKEASEEHDKLVNYWKDAIQLAETRSASWPLHVKMDGTLEYDLDDDRMNDVIVEAIEMKHLEEEKEKKKEEEDKN